MILLLAAAGVGLGSINGIMQFVKNKSLKVMIMPGLAICVGLTVIAAFDKNARDLIGVAWDAGGITTGTVTAPLVLALGVGMARALGKSDTGMSGFGIITLCSIWPIALVMLFSLIFSWGGIVITPEQFAALQGGGRVGRDRRERGIFSLIWESHVVLHLGAAADGRALPRAEADPEGAGPEPGPGDRGHRPGAHRPDLLQGRPGHGPQLAGRPGSKATLAFDPNGGIYGLTLGRIVVMLFAGVVGYGACWPSRRS